MRSRADPVRRGTARPAAGPVPSGRTARTLQLQGAIGNRALSRLIDDGGLEYEHYHEWRDPEPVPERKKPRAKPAPKPVPPPPPKPPEPEPPHTCFPVELGHNDRGIADGDDFRSHDDPQISWWSDYKLRAWAWNLYGRHWRGVSDEDLEGEMRGVLWALAGPAGVEATKRFIAGDTVVWHHDNDSQLGRIALADSRFHYWVDYVGRQLELQIQRQRRMGQWDPCQLRASVPKTDFTGLDALGAVIGGTQAETVTLHGMEPIGPSHYELDLGFTIQDDFGVDEDDLYSPGLFPFWVLQHTRGSEQRYNPYVNQLDLRVKREVYVGPSYDPDPIFY